MKPMIFALLFLLTLTSAKAADALTDKSPDGRFAFLKINDSIQVVELPSRKVVIAEAFGDPRMTKSNLTVAWSKDSSRFAACVQSARFGQCVAYERRNGSFSKMTLPDLGPPDFKGKEISRGFGETRKPEQWKDGMLVLITNGAVKLTNSTRVDYTYEFTLAFGERGKGKIAEVQKKHYEVN